MTTTTTISRPLTYVTEPAPGESALLIATLEAGDLRGSVHCHCTEGGAFYGITDPTGGVEFVATRNEAFQALSDWGLSGADDESVIIAVHVTEDEATRWVHLTAAWLRGRLAA